MRSGAHPATPMRWIAVTWMTRTTSATKMIRTMFIAHLCADAPQFELLELVEYPRIVPFPGARHDEKLLEGVQIRRAHDADPFRYSALVFRDLEHGAHRKTLRKEQSEPARDERIPDRRYPLPSRRTRAGRNSPDPIRAFPTTRLRRFMQLTEIDLLLMRTTCEDVGNTCETRPTSPRKPTTAMPTRTESPAPRSTMIE